ncbi:hypothetical protein QYF61_010552 [Mycteria americana]|uniref:Uncharacterized protein n=1 Tax=Mycteria americana TaxID=33587 RepID=A0AAN7RZG8_MYCAM|nr:hypothetical protein QYF61_010552 [Mycteria americana]
MVTAAKAAPDLLISSQLVLVCKQEIQWSSSPRWLLSSLAQEAILQATYGVVCPVLVPTSQEGRRRTGEGPKEGQDDGQRAGEPALGGKTGVGSLLPGEEKTWGGPHHSSPVLKGWRLSLHKEPRGEDKGQRVQVAPGEVSSQLRLYVETSCSLEECPRGHGGVPITGGSQDEPGWGVR